MSFILLIIGFILLVKCSDMFVDGCSNIAKAFGIPSLIIGLTIVAFGTSAPETAVSVIASLNRKNTISIGNVVGSNICNLLLVLGTSSLFGVLTAKRKIITRDSVYSIFAYVTLMVLTAGAFISGANKGTITRTNGVVLLCFLVFYLYILLKDARSNKNNSKERIPFSFKDIIYSIIGLIGIILGGNFVVEGAVDIAKLLGVSDNVIALTVVAIGTSLPELFTSVTAARKGESDIAIGNVIGSNIFNIFFILGTAATLSPITLGIESFIDIIIMLFVGVFIHLLISKNQRITRKKGIVMLSIYLLYTVYIIVR